MDEELISIDQVAGLFQVDRSTIHKWIRAGRLQACKMTGKSKAIKRSEVERFMTEEVLKQDWTSGSPGESAMPIGIVGWLTAQKVADLAGLKRGTIVKAKARGKIDGIVVAGRAYFHPDAVRKWLAGRTKSQYRKEP